MIENSIIGCLINKPSLISRSGIRFDDFKSENNQTIFRAILSMQERQLVVDVITLAEFLERTVMPGDWLQLLGDRVASRGVEQNYKAYASILRTEATTHLAKQIGQQLADDGNTEAAIQQLLKLNTGTDTNVYSIGQAQIDAINHSEEVEKGNIAPGILTGLNRFDAHLGGFHNSDLIVIAGRTGMGKTAVALNLIRNIKNVTGIVSMEQSVLQIGQRMLAMNSGVPVSYMRNGRISQLQWTDIANAPGSDKNAWIVDAPVTTIEQMKRDARMLVNDYRIEALFVDYTQKVEVDADSHSNWGRVGQVITGMKAIARELDIPVIALAQVKREAVERDGPPTMEDIAESGHIEREADQVITLYRPHVYDETKPVTEMWLNVAKNRHGRSGKIQVQWIPETMTVRDSLEDAR